MSVHAHKQSKSKCINRKKRHKKPNLWANIIPRLKTMFSHTSVPTCGWPMQMKISGADRMPCLPCSLSGMKRSIEHAYMRVLQSTNGCTWARLHQQKSVKMHTSGAFLVELIRKLCDDRCGGHCLAVSPVKTCQRALTSQPTDLLFWWEIIRGARLQLWTNATPFQSPHLPPPLPVANSPPPPLPLGNGDGCF